MATPIQSHAARRPSVNHLKVSRNNAAVIISGPSGTAIKPYNCNMSVAAESMTKSPASRRSASVGRMMRQKTKR